VTIRLEKKEIDKFFKNIKFESLKNIKVELKKNIKIKNFKNLK